MADERGIVGEARERRPRPCGRAIPATRRRLRPPRRNRRGSRRCRAGCARGVRCATGRDAAPTSCVYGRVGVGAAHACRRASRRAPRRARAAVSRTVRVTHSSTFSMRVDRRRARHRARCGRATASTRRGRNSSRECGSSRHRRWRDATATMPLATAAAEPPLEPPVVRVGVPRVARRAVRERLGRGHEPSSGVLVRPMHTKPASRNARARCRCDRRGSPRPSAAPMPSWYGSPSTAESRSLNRIGTPRNGPSGSGPRGLRACLVVERVDDRVELAVQLLDAVDRGVDELERVTPRRVGRARPGRSRRGMRRPWSAPCR